MEESHGELERFRENVAGFVTWGEGADPHAHLALAMESHWYEWDWAAADREFKRALELGPNNGDA
jgi:hypothetical protein